MNKNFFRTLYSWSKNYITDTDLAVLVGRSDAARYALVNRALKEGILIHIRRGLFLVAPVNEKKLVDPFELAQIIYGLSFISCQSALMYHDFIPQDLRIENELIMDWQEAILKELAKNYPSQRTRRVLQRLLRIK